MNHAKRNVAPDDLKRLERTLHREIPITQAMGVLVTFVFFGP